MVNVRYMYIDSLIKPTILLQSIGIPEPLGLGGLVLFKFSDGRDHLQLIPMLE